MDSFHLVSIPKLANFLGLRFEIRLQNGWPFNGEFVPAAPEQVSVR